MKPAIRYRVGQWGMAISMLFVTCVVCLTVLQIASVHIYARTFTPGLAISIAVLVALPFLWRHIMAKEF